MNQITETSESVVPDQAGRGSEQSEEGTGNDDRQLDVEYVALVILSTVARMQGERGLSVMLDVMRGSKAKRIVEAGYHELPVYGLLEWIPRRRLQPMAEVLIDGGFITRGEYQVLGLRAAGTAVMTGEVSLPKAVARNMKHAYETAPVDRPRYREGAPTLRKTYNMVRQGMGPAEIAERRDMALTTIVKHLFALASYGAKFDLSLHIEPDFLVRLQELGVQWRLGDPLTPVHELFEEDLDWEELKIHLLYLHMQAEMA